MDWRKGPSFLVTKCLNHKWYYKFFFSLPFSQNGDGVQFNAPLLFWSLGEKENCSVTARIILSPTTSQTVKLHFSWNGVRVCLFTISDEINNKYDDDDDRWSMIDDKVHYICTEHDDDDDDNNDDHTADDDDWGGDARHHEAPEKVKIRAKNAKVLINTALEC